MSPVETGIRAACKAVAGALRVVNVIDGMQPVHGVQATSVDAGAAADEPLDNNVPFIPNAAVSGFAAPQRASRDISTGSAVLSTRARTQPV